ncbi:MAG TPA: nucleotidyltransferase family protein [Tepidisphaeraceae bacterium]|nr:nucleotidyltransferase family protein [Tepidisphaeraceae bacterium]
MPDELLIAILAAGASRRLGRPKQLVELNGETLVRRQCKTAIEARIGSVVVVLGCDHEQIAPEVSDLKLRILMNDDWREGVAASVRVSTLAAIDAGAAALLIIHCDQYAITSADLIRLHQAWQSSQTSAHLSRDGDHLGPPAILPARLFPSMLTLKGDSGPRAILRNDPDVCEVPMPFASKDVDLPDDLNVLGNPE